jgi:hypothetical protein
MKSFRLFRRKPAPQRRRRSATSPWLRKIIKTESAKKLVQNMIENNAVVQAAIIHSLTGLDINAADVKIETPEEAFERIIFNAAIKDLARDERFIEEAKQILMDRAYGSIGFLGRGGGQGGGPPGSQNSGGAGRLDPLYILDLAEQIKAKVGGASTLEAVMKSPVLIEIIKTIIPALLSRMNNQQQGQTTPPSDLIEVEVDGQLVEMTMRGYETWKRLKGRVAGGVDSPAGPPAGDSPEPSPALASTPAVSEAGATAPQLAGSPDSTGSSGPAAQAEVKPFPNSPSASP